MTNSADPDQLASLEANWSGSTLFAKTGLVVFSKRRVKYALATTKATIRPVWPERTQIILYFHTICQGFSFIPLWIARRLYQPRLWSDCADAQTDLSLRWSHKCYCRFRLALAHIKCELAINIIYNVPRAQTEWPVYAASQSDKSSLFTWTIWYEDIKRKAKTEQNVWLYRLIPGRIQKDFWAGGGGGCRFNHNTILTLRIQKDRPEQTV